MLLIHSGDDGIGAAHRLVADPDGLGGLDIRQTVVVDDLQNLRLVQARYGLGLLVVVHQDHLLAAGPQQMVAGQGAHHPLLLIQNGIGPEAAFQHGVLHVVDIVVQVEAHQILVLADETANPHFVAADLLSQAEHDELACAILITTSEEFAKKVDEEVKGFVEVLSRKEIIQKSLDNFGYILIAEDMDEAIEAANEIAPEHMEIVTANPFEDMMKVKNAGAIFIGEYSSEPLGDYFAGPNHVLPTNGTAKFFSALSVDDFIKKSSIVYYSKSALRNIHKDIIQFATSEQLTAHANSIAVRFEDEDKE